MLQNSEKSCCAYLTVEATLLLPMVLCTMVVGIYTAFYLYDRCLFTQDAYLLCLRESYRKDEGSPSVDPEDMESDVSDLLGEKYFAVDSMEGTASADGKWAVYEGSATTAPAVFGSFFLMPKNIWTMSFSAKSRKNDPAWSIRNWRRKSHVLEDGISYISDELKSSSE